MEKIGCKKHGAALEIKDAVKYYEADNVCRSCPHFSICEEEYEEQNICHQPRT